MAVIMADFAKRSPIYLILISFIASGCFAGEADKGGKEWLKIAPQNYPLERKWVSSDRYPWRAIGRVNLAGRGHCSGTLIGDNLVLTSAHCLWNKRTEKWFPSQFITFEAGAEKDSFQDYSHAHSFRVSPGFSPKTLHKPQAIKSDWAVIRLEKSLGQQLGFLPLANDQQIVTGQQITQAGYRADRPYVLTVENNCLISELYDNNLIFRTSCKTLGGDSGGPVLIQSSGKWFLAGIHRGRTEKNQSLVVSSKSFRSAVKAD